MDNISTILDNIYSYEYFGPIIFGVTAFLIVLFFIILFFGKKDEKKSELESTKQLELASLNAFDEKDAAKNLYDKANEIDFKAKEEEIFARLDNLVLEAKAENMSGNDIEFPSISINEQPQTESALRNVPEFDFKFDDDKEEVKEDAKEEVKEEFEFPNFEGIAVESPVVSAINADNSIKEELDASVAAPILEPVKNDEIVINQTIEPTIEAPVVEEETFELQMAEEAPVVDEDVKPDLEVNEVKDKFSSLATSIDEELSNLENMIKENNKVSISEEPIVKDDGNLKNIIEEKPVNLEKPLSSKDIPGAKQIFSSVFVAPKKEEEVPEEYNNDDFENKFNSLLKGETEEKKVEDTKEKVEEPIIKEEEKKDEPTVKSFNFKIKEAPKNKMIDLPKKADVDLPKLNKENDSEKITKADFPEFPSLTNELESYRR